VTKLFNYIPACCLLTGSLGAQIPPPIVPAGLDDNEHNFGVTGPDLRPKPAYDALRQMVRELGGFQLRERLAEFDEKDFVLLFAKRDGAQKVVAWSLAKSHAIRLTRWQPEVSLELGPLPQYVSVK
jgi:hypothetical protein